MARRGAMTAIQAALAGLSGGAAGYVRQRELQKEQDRLKKQEERQQRIDILDLLERGGVTQAAPGESITGPVPSAVPMVAPQREAMAAALQAAGPRTGAGSEMFNIGGTSILMPSKAQRDLQASQRAFDAAIQQAEATGAVRMRQEREAGQEAQRMAFNELRALGQESGEFDPNRMYTTRLEDFLLRRRARESKPSTTAGDLSQLVVQRASALRDDFRAEPAVKKSETIADATRLVRASAASPTAAGDLSLIFAYMRVLDPSSVVREREFANAQNAAGVPDQVRNLYNRVLEGTRLNDRQRRDFVARANDIAQQQSKSIQAQIARFGRISERYGVPSDLVVYDPFEGLFEQAEPAPAIGGTGSPRDVTGGMPEMSRVDLSGNPYRRGARP